VLGKTVRRAVLPLSLLLALPPAACGGDGGEPESRPKAAALAPVSQANVAPQGLPEIPKVRGAVGALADLDAGTCATEPGDITVAGTVRNPTEKTTDYAITVSWINDRFDVRNRAVATVKDLRAGRAARWAVHTKLEADNATQCTFFVQRGSLAVSKEERFG
jgi:hypothetical protein